MKTELFDNYDSLSRKASEIILEKQEENPELLLCLASGSSPTGTYQNLVEACTKSPESFEKVNILKLDEWGGISMNNPESCETYLQKNLVKPLNISPKRYISFQSNVEKPELEINRISDYMKQKGPIDICVLGLGLNGHVAFNEPSESLFPHSHIVKLSDKSMEHRMAKNMGEVSTYGLTIGMADILQSKKIIIIVTGSGKMEIIKDFLSGKVTTKLPASFLWLHPDTICLVDKEAL